MFNKMSLYRVKKGLVYLRYFGPKEFMIRLKERIRFQKIDYEKWYQNHRRTKEELERQRQVFVCTPDQYCCSGISGAGGIFDTDAFVSMPADL